MTDIDDLPAELGLDLSLLASDREVLVQAWAGGWDNRQQLASIYRELAELPEQAVSNENFARARVALIVHMSLIWRDAGDEELYREELFDAIDYANNMGYDDIVQVLERELRE